MKRLHSNLLTVAVAVAVLLAGVAYSSFLLPVMTDNMEEGVLDCNVKLTNPQEIIELPASVIDPSQQFPVSYRSRVLLDNQNLDEQTVQTRKNFLGSVSEAVDVLFNIKVDSIVMEKLTQVWRYEEQPDEEGMSASSLSKKDAFWVDVLFTDARAVRWRITAGGYADRLIHVSCVENSLLLSPPFNPVANPPYENIEGIEKVDSAVNWFKFRLYSLPDLGSMVKQESCKQYNTVVNSTGKDILWAIHFEYNGSYLISGFSRESLTPVSYTFLNFEQEMGYDPYRSFLGRETGSSLTS